MAVEAQAGVAEVKVAVEQLDRPGRRILARPGLQHGGRMAAVVLVGPADRVAQRPGPAIGRLDDSVGRGRPPVAIDRRIGRHRRARQHGVDIGAQLLQLLGPDDALEHVEAVRPVRLHDLRQQTAVGADPDRSAIAQSIGAGLGAPAVVAHGAFVLGGAGCLDSNGLRDGGGSGGGLGGGDNGHGGAPDDYPLGRRAASAEDISARGARPTWKADPQKPHPEEDRAAMRLEGWATTRQVPTLRDGPAGLLRVRLGRYLKSINISTGGRRPPSGGRKAPGSIARARGAPRSSAPPPG